MWSSGVVLYELCLLEKMFSGSILSITRDIVKCNYNKDKLENLSPFFKLLIKKLVRIQPERRWNINKICKVIDLYESEKTLAAVYDNITESDDDEGSRDNANGELEEEEIIMPRHSNS